MRTPHEELSSAQLSEQLEHTLDRTREHCTVPAYDDRPLHEHRMRDHALDQALVADILSV
jgi:hypothetical protein